jgi:hypothetical protein
LLRVLGRLPLIDAAAGSGGRRPRSLNRRRLMKFVERRFNLLQMSVSKA